MSPTWKVLLDDSPLNDEAFVPEHPPVDGRVPEVVERWAAASQVRWFNRFAGELALRGREWNRWFVESVEHRGLCCPSCIEEQGVGYVSFDECCCEAFRRDQG